MADKKNGTNGHRNGAGGFMAPASAEAGAHETAQPRLSVGESLAGKRILVTGTTGFLGKVFASQLLTMHADLEHLYLLIRPKRSASADERFFEEIVSAGAFDPVREAQGDRFDDFLREKVTVLAGDITDVRLGLSEEDAAALSSRLDLFVNSAGLTNFNPNLESALTINTLSMERILDFIKLGGSRAKLLHVSTCFVAGRTNKPSQEILPTRTCYPAYDELHVEFDPRREVNDCWELIDHTEKLADDQEHQSVFAREARDWLKKHNLNPDNPTLFAEAKAQARAKWVKKRLSQEGRERASHWGWVNIYTYTKSLAERLLVEEADDVEYTIFRPAIIESAVSFPKTGWNEGINTTAPLSYFVYKGHRFVPSRASVDIDVIPIDYVTGALAAVSAALLSGQSHPLYHIGSSDQNPISVSRTVELAQLAARRLIDRDVKKPAWQRTAIKSLDARTVDIKTFERRSVPVFKKAARGVQDLIDRVPTKQLGGFGKALTAMSKQARQVEKLADTGMKIFEIFMPFIYENEYTFIARNIGELAERMSEEERAVYGCDISELDWRHYWIDVHVPGLSRYVFPHFEAKLKASRKESHSYDDLVELFEASTANFANRVAFQHHDGGIVERYTYAELRHAAGRVASFLRALGAGEGATVMLASENRPQWGMVYFGTLQAGAVAVPVDPEASALQIFNLARSCEPTVIVLSPQVRERIGAELDQALAEAKLDTEIVDFSQVFALQLGDESSDEGISEEAAHDLVHLEDEGESPLASLIYTSGTTGDPKGVMLSHQNFTALLQSLQSSFDIDDRDGFLSVLPLHHTFEFACGFLMPFSRGATITYMEELSGEELRSAMTSTRVTAMIGVPALWQLLHRRIDQQVEDSHPAARWLFKNFLAMNRTLRDRTGLNVGPTLFSTVHRAFGSQIRYLISGGASLPADVLEAFYGLGFNLYEGYGLTEAAPVLTVNRPQDGLVPGSVGRALPGVEIAIKNPDKEGVGEVIARGDNVMRGYLGREEETARALQDGWLHTGDLGKIDHKGRLTIVGRRKEVIVTSGGKNVYPDELEEIYGKGPGVLELAVVGLPDGQGSERVACLVRPDVEDDADDAAHAEARQRVREWFRIEAGRVAPHNRIQVLRFWDEELPRTPTRKVKRSEVVQILERLVGAEQAEATRLAEEADGKSQAAGGEARDDDAWIRRTVATLAGFDPGQIHPGTHFQDDLAFDSLMTVELVSLLAERNYHVTSDQLAGVHTVGQLQALLADPQRASTALVTTTASTLARVNEIPIHPALARATRRLLHNAQMRAYGDLFDVEVYGKANIPHHNPNVIVVANHSSHLDMGLVKYALGEFGREIRALAAADYFFRNTARKTYFKNFTNLIPVERAGTPDVALRGAVESLHRGETLLMFPEGTRAPDGKLRKFRRGLGYLVADQKVGILPVYIEGTHRALPKGQALPSPTSRKLKVRIGKLIDPYDLLAETEEKQLSDSDTWEFISQQAYQAIADLAAPPISQKYQQMRLEPLFEELHEKFEADQVDEPVSYYFSLGSVDDQKWTVVVDSDTCDVKQGKPEDGPADCVVKTSPELFRKIVQERYIPSMQEFMDGTIKTNSPDLLMRFQAVFRLQG